MGGVNYMHVYEISYFHTVIVYISQYFHIAAYCKNRNLTDESFMIKLYFYGLLVTAVMYMFSSAEEEFIEPPDELKIEDDDVEVIIAKYN